jgi:uncharacterized phage protein (TIGR01671 family)
MREIKFRAFISKESRYNSNIGMISGESIKTMLNPKFTKIYGEHCWEEVGLVLMQFTGLKDKNGKEIYEGDIVICDYGIGKVVYNSGCFMVEWFDDKEVYMEFLFSKKGLYSRTKDEEFKVVGNIYEDNVTHIIYSYLNFGERDFN